MLARRIASILPELTLEEALEAMRIHSVAGSLKSHQALVLLQPLEDGHVTISRAVATFNFPSQFMLVAAMNDCR